MNTAKLYSAAVGRETQPEKTEEEVEREFIQKTLTEEHSKWLELSETKKFFSELEKLEQSYFRRSQELFCGDTESKNGMKCVIKSATIREIIEIYATR